MPLGVLMITVNLTWNDQIEEFVNKASRKRYPPSNIYGLLPKKCDRPTYNLRIQKIFDLHKTNTKRFHTSRLD